MKKNIILLCIFLCIAALAVFFITKACPPGQTKHAVITVGESTKFSQEEIQKAMDLVLKEFTHFTDCDLTGLWYDEAKSDLEATEYLQSTLHSAAGITEGNVIFLFSSFNTGAKSYKQGFSPNMHPQNWSWILTRANKNSPWKLVDWGY